MSQVSYSKNNSPFPEKRLHSVVEDVLRLAKEKGASSAESKIHLSRGFDLTVRHDKLENILDQKSQEFGVTIYFGSCSGTATTTDLSEDAIKKAVDKACYIAKYTTEDDCAGLADKDLLAFDYKDLKLYYPWDLSIAAAKKLARECERSGFEYAQKLGGKIDNSEGAEINFSQSYFVYMNSSGFVGSHPSSFYAYNCALVAEEKGDMQRGSGYTLARDPRKLFSPNEVGKEAAQKVLMKLGAKEIATRTCPVLFIPQVAKGLIKSFLGAVSGGSLYRKASFLIDSLGEQVFPNWMVIDERPNMMGGLCSAPFDIEGVRTVERNIVEAGCVGSYLLSSYSARKLKMRSTGNCGGARNVFVNSSGESFQELVKKMHSGLVVVEVMGQGVNMVTGDYSRGMVGLWVENGEVKYPVHGVTIAGNLKDMYRDVVAIGKDVDHRGNVHVGSILIDNMVVAGVGG